jgi:small-conductance mechanosensitive channel
VAQNVGPPPAPSPEVRQLLKLLEDPGVRAWLQASQRQGEATDAAPAPEPTPQSPASVLSERLARIHTHFGRLAAALPRIPQEIAAATQRAAKELEDASVLGILGLIAAFLGSSLAAAVAFQRASRPAYRAAALRPADDVVPRDRTRLLPLALAAGGAVSLGLGGVAAILLLGYPPLLGETLLALLLAVVATRLATVLVAFVLDPHRMRPTSALPQDRLVAMSDDAARFWARRIVAFVGYFAFGYALVTLMRTYGVSREVAQIAAYALGLGLLAIAVEATWRRPAPAPRPGSWNAMNLLVTAYLVALWGIWVAGALGLFWIGVYAGFLAKAVGWTGTVARRLVGPEAAAGDTPSLLAVIVERGARAALLILAALWLAYVLQIQPDALQAQDTMATRLARGVAAAVIILLIADLVWQLARTAIARAMVQNRIDSGLSDTELARRTRLQTLLPILRNMLLAIVLVTALLMALAALGIEIGPLIAGAGVVGVAIGFGAQTLVKDVISGVFYLLDDAFRVGEYIQSGNYKGTVESFSLRSVKLRHHRGPVYTVPFGSLGAVQNMSRDWVIDKFVVRVAYDTDLGKVKKLVKTIGAELQADPEFKPHILETLKMQGVDQFGEFALELRFKMMTKPGEQFAIRRRAFAMIKQAFADNGIQIALPTVQVADAAGDAARSVAAKEAMDLVRKSEAADQT